MKHIISFAIRYIPRKYLQLFSHIAARVISIFYIGDKVECPICHAQFKKFLPYGRVSRENALCPKCLSLERHRLLWLFLKKRTNFFKDNLRVLHIAPELCFIKRFENQKNIDYMTGDIESPLAKIKLDVHALPFQEGSFDVCLCNHVLEHVDDDLKAMREIHRILVPGGWAIMQIPLFHPIPEKTIAAPGVKSPKERERLFGQSDHVRKYGQDYPDRLSDAGFKVTEINLTANLDQGLVERYGLPEGEKIYLATKSLQS